MADALAAALAEIAVRERHSHLVGDCYLPRLLAAVDAVLARHVPKTVTVTRLCGAHHRIVIPDCPDCVKRQVTTCAACDPVCPDDNTWPCANYQAISRALTGEDGQ